MLKVFGPDGPLASSDLQEIQGQRWHFVTSSGRFEDLNSRKKYINKNNNNMRI